MKKTDARTLGKTITFPTFRFSLFVASCSRGFARELLVALRRTGAEPSICQGSGIRLLSSVGKLIRAGALGLVDGPLDQPFRRLSIAVS